MRIAAVIFLAGAIWAPLLRWDRLTQLQRYAAMVALGAAFAFYLAHPTRTACEQADVCDQSGY